MSANSRVPRLRHAQMRGLSLIELMISIVLGLILVAAAGGIFMSNQQTYRATESLGRVQENSMVAFELMSREIREAGGSPCDSSIAPATVLNTVAWSNNLAAGIQGYDNGVLWATPPAGASATADGLEIISATGNVYSMARQVASTDTLALTATDHTLVQGDIALVCDFQCATIFQKTDATAMPSGVVQHVAGVAVLPGNSAASFVCSTVDLTAHAYGADSLVSEVRASRWYVGNNTNGGQSLFRAPVDQGVLQAGQEIVEGVADMQLTYLERNETAYTAPGGVADWRQVVAVRIALTLQGNQRVGTDGSPVSRTLSHVVTLRNRAL